MVENNLLFGVGAGNWKVEFPKYGIDKFNYEARMGKLIFTRPHNDFLGFFSELGIIGFVIYCSIFIISAFYLIKLIRYTKENNEKEKFIVLLLTLLGFAFISFFDFPMERIEHKILFFLIMAIICSEYFKVFIKIRLIEKNIAIKKNIRLYNILTLTFLVFFSLFISIKRYNGEKNTVYIFKAHLNGNWQQLVRIIDKTKNNYYQLDPTAVPLDWYKGVALFALGNLQDALFVFESAYNFAPYNIHVLNNLASTYEKNGFHDKAINFYLKALAISPEFEESILNLSAVYFNIKEYEKAFETINKCSIITTEPKYKLFLPPILRSYLNILKEKNNLINHNLLKLNNEELVQFYFDKKNRNINIARMFL